MKRSIYLIFIVVLLPGIAFAQSKSKPPPPRPAVVVVAPVEAGEAQPMSDFVGTVYYARVSNVAAEAEGQVERVGFDEGDSVRAGSVLVELDTELLDISIRQMSATYGEAQSQLERARKDLERMEILSRQKSVAVSTYDDHVFKVRGLELKVHALKALLDREKLVKSKMTIRAPFDGIVIRKNVENGEWVSRGSVVGIVAMDHQIDVLVNVPEEVLKYLKKDAAVPLRLGHSSMEGRYLTVIPKGDEATRTFAIKIRIDKPVGLIEGMEARAVLPSGPNIKGLLVPRDAVINKFGQDVVFVENEGAAKMVPVKVLGYRGFKVGIAGPGLSAGMQAVVKGNERLRAGQPLKIISK